MLILQGPMLATGHRVTAMAGAFLASWRPCVRAGEIAHKEPTGMTSVSHSHSLGLLLNPPFEGGPSVGPRDAAWMQGTGRGGEAETGSHSEKVPGGRQGLCGRFAGSWVSGNREARGWADGAPGGQEKRTWPLSHCPHTE